MKNKKLTRTCIGCKQKKEKYDLIRIVKNKKGEIKVDLCGKLEGRGAYICKNEECYKKAVKSNRLKTALKANIQNELHEELKGVIFDCCK